MAKTYESALVHHGGEKKLQASPGEFEKGKKTAISFEITDIQIAQEEKHRKDTCCMIFWNLPGIRIIHTTVFGKHSENIPLSYTETATAACVCVWGLHTVSEDLESSKKWWKLNGEGTAIPPMQRTTHWQNLICGRPGSQYLKSNQQILIGYWYWEQGSVQYVLLMPSPTDTGVDSVCVCVCVRVCVCVLL